MTRWMLALALGISLLTGPALADTAFQFSTVGFQAPKDPDVNGIRLAIIFGENKSQRGLDFGILSMSQTSKLSGLSLIGGLCKVTGDMENGVSLSAANWHLGNDSGLNVSFANMVNNSTGALNFAFLNIADGSTMADVGAFNMSQKSKVQIGMLNITDRIEGVQIGLLNMAPNGFLPIFPIFNFSTD